MGTQPAHDRHDGFHEFTDKEPGIKYLLNQQSGDWKQDQAYDIMATALRNNEKIDLVYGHNDPMAYGAYLAAKDAGREKDIKFIGIDALPDEGVTWVKNGELTATFLYATPGAEGLRQAVKFLNGEKVEKTDRAADREGHRGERRRRSSRKRVSRVSLHPGRRTRRPAAQASLFACGSRPPEFSRRAAPGDRRAEGEAEGPR